jgi:hypothetical protein
MPVVMRLVDELSERAASEPSLFRAQLMREDVGRLAKLDALARSEADDETYRSAGRRLGWTAQDARTGELGDALDRLLDAVRDATRRGDDEAAQARVREAWIELTRVRLERLIGCLSTPVPKPVD